MNFAEIIITTSYVSLLIVIVIKTILFNKSTSHKNTSRYIYFNTENIYNSSNPQKERAKVLQNQLSIAIAIIAAFAAIVTFIILK